MTTDFFSHVLSDKICTPVLLFISQKIRRKNIPKKNPINKYNHRYPDYH